MESLKTPFQWVNDALNESMKNSVQFIDTGPVWNLHYEVFWQVTQKQSLINYTDKELENTLNIYEAAVVYKLVETLLQVGIYLSYKFVDNIVDETF